MGVVDTRGITSEIFRALNAADIHPVRDIPTEAYRVPGLYDIIYTGPLSYAVPDHRVVYVGNSGKNIAQRIKLYRTLVKAAENLDVAQCFFRFVELEEWMIGIETLRIRALDPVWNWLGIATRPGGRYTQVAHNTFPRPAWHILHPGWDGVALFEPMETPDEIIQRLQTRCYPEEARV